MANTSGNRTFRRVSGNWPELGGLKAEYRVMLIEGHSTVEDIPKILETRFGKGFSIETIVED